MIKSRIKVITSEPDVLKNWNRLLHKFFSLKFLLKNTNGFGILREFCCPLELWHNSDRRTWQKLNTKENIIYFFLFLNFSDVILWMKLTVAEFFKNSNRYLYRNSAHKNSQLYILLRKSYGYSLWKFPLAFNDQLC